MKKLKAAITYLVARPLLDLSFFVFIKGHKFTSITIGHVMFWGDAHFLELARQAMEHLETLDTHLYELITTGRKLRFYSSQKSGGLVAGAGLFSLDDGFCELGVQGVIARIVYGYFVAKAIGDQHFSKAERHRSRQLGREAEDQTRSWLEEKKFSAAVCQVFRHND